MAQFSNHFKILLTKPTTKLQEAKLVERPRHVRGSVRKHEVGVVQASQPHFITEELQSFCCDPQLRCKKMYGSAAENKTTSVLVQVPQQDDLI